MLQDIPVPLILDYIPILICLQLRLFVLLCVYILLLKNVLERFFKKCDVKPPLFGGIVIFIFCFGKIYMLP